MNSLRIAVAPTPKPSQIVPNPTVIPLYCISFCFALYMLIWWYKLSITLPIISCIIGMGDIFNFFPQLDACLGRSIPAHIC